MSLKFNYVFVIKRVACVPGLYKAPRLMFKFQVVFTVRSKNLLLPTQ
jgi:hypothetical protein